MPPPTLLGTMSALAEEPGPAGTGEYVGGILIRESSDEIPVLLLTHLQLVIAC